MHCVTVYNIPTYQDSTYEQYVERYHSTKGAYIHSTHAAAEERIPGPPDPATATAQAAGAQAQAQAKARTEPSCELSCVCGRLESRVVG